jgi:negative regulator of sigma E activity
MGSCDPELVSALVDGEADDHDTEAALRHLTACSDCQELFDRYSAVRSMVRGEVGAPAPEGLAERIGAAVAAEPARRARVVRLPVWGPRRGAALAAGLAAAAVVTSLAWYQSGPSVSSGSSSPSMAATPMDRPAPDSRAPVSAESQPRDPEIQRYVQEHSRLLSGDARFRRTGLETSGP